MELRKLTKLIQVEAGMPRDQQDGIWGPNTANAVYHYMKESSLPDDEIRNAGFDQRTENNLKTLQPRAQTIMRPFVRHAKAVANSYGVEAKVICGLRNREDQEAAVAAGASRAGYGYSWHNFGMAIDLGLFAGTKYVDAADPVLARRIYQAIGILAPQYNLEWGGTWSSFKDYPHFQVKMGRSTPLAHERKQLMEGTFVFA